MLFQQPISDYAFISGKFYLYFGSKSFVSAFVYSRNSMKNRPLKRSVISMVGHWRTLFLCSKGEIIDHRLRMVSSTKNLLYSLEVNQFRKKYESYTITLTGKIDRIEIYSFVRTLSRHGFLAFSGTSYEGYFDLYGILHCYF